MAQYRSAMLVGALILGSYCFFLACSQSSSETEVGAATSVAGMKTAASFDAIEDKEERSKALFVEAGRVLQHPRCLNCHPSDAHPRQGEDIAMHDPPVVRGYDNHGTSPMQCATCHQVGNVDHGQVPGHPAWHLAPREMGWIGKSLYEICDQIKDQERNGGMDLKALHRHMAEDSLVGWAWAPGEGREPAPGTQAAFGELIQAWIDTGAHCPDGEAGRSRGPVPKVDAACANCHATMGVRR